jgi:predicted nucleic acid-binding protein
MSRNVVVDASFALKWVLQEPYTAEAAHLQVAWAQADIECIAPAWFAAEIANVMYRQVRAGLLDMPHAEQSVAGLLSTVQIEDSDVSLIPRAMEIAATTGRSAVYDALYAALAERTGCDLWTADERFYDAARPHFSFVHWVGEVKL